MTEKHLTLQQPKITDKAKVYLGGSLVGMTRVILGFPVEHPIDAIKVQWQAQPHFKNEFQIVKHVYHTKGIRGFYAGAIPNMTRLIARNSYKYPLLIGMPQFFKEYAPGDNAWLLKLGTGFSVALLESLITCPIDRTKTFLMTQKNLCPHQSSFKIFYNHIFNQQSKVQELFRGFGPLFLRQLISWSVFLQTDLLTKTFIRKTYAIPDHETIPTKMLMASSCFVALINTTIVMPVDCIKTHIAKVDPSATYAQAARDIYTKSGNTYMGFFTGVRLRFLLYLTNALFTVNILERLENKVKKL